MSTEYYILCEKANGQSDIPLSNISLVCRWSIEDTWIQLALEYCISNSNILFVAVRISFKYSRTADGEGRGLAKEEEFVTRSQA
jgi:hypothetical protein